MEPRENHQWRIQLSSVTFYHHIESQIMNAQFSSRVLSEHQVRRESFDSNNKEHRASLKKFLETGNWGDVQFFTEYPYVTVPETVFRKFALAMLTRWSWSIPAPFDHTRIQLSEPRHIRPYYRIIWLLRWLGKIECAIYTNKKQREMSLTRAWLSLVCNTLLLFQTELYYL